MPVEVPKVQEPPAPPNTSAGRAAWARDLVGSLEDIGLTHLQAMLFGAHLVREIGWGQYVWDYNFGNIKWYPGNPHDYYWLTDSGGSYDRYRAYTSAQDGLQDVVALVRDVPRYQGAWAKLLAGDPTWYGTLGLEGYYEGPRVPGQPNVHTTHTPETIAPVQAEYDDIFNLLRHYVDGTPYVPGTGSANTSGASNTASGGGIGTILAIAAIGIGGFVALRAYQRGELGGRRRRR